jgi:hypothetical protein
MKPILISLSNNVIGLHESRMWSLASRIMNVAECVTTTDGYWPEQKDGFGGAIVFSSDADHKTLRRMREFGVPVIFYPSFGPVIDGFFSDTCLHFYGHALFTRIRMQLANTVLVDSWHQAKAAQNHFGVSVPYIVSPGGVAMTKEQLPQNSRSSWCEDNKAVLWTVDPVDDWAEFLHNWCKDTDWAYMPARCSWEQAASMARNASEFATPDMIFLPQPQFHPDITLTLLETGVPVLTPDVGLLDFKAPNFFGLPTRPISGLTVTEPAALSPIFETARKAKYEKVKLPSNANWDSWEKDVMGTLRTLGQHA